MEEIRKKVLNCIKHNSWAKRDYKIFYSNWRKHYPRNIIRQDYLKWHNQQEKKEKKMRIPKMVRFWRDQFISEGEPEKIAMYHAIQRAYEANDITEKQANQLERELEL